MNRLIKWLFPSVALLLSFNAHSISLSLDGTITTISGTDCDIATYRLGLNEQWNGQALDLLVEVVAEDNEYDPATLPCVGIEAGVFSVSLRDTDPGDDVAFVDTVFTVVQAGTMTPVFVDRITATGFDLDSAGSTDTDDVYLSGTGATYLSGNTNVTYSQGAFPGGHDVKLKGQTIGNCADAPTTPVVGCRGSASWVGGSGINNQIATFNARFQNDNAYGQYTGTFNARRLLQLSLEDQHAEELFTAISDHGDAPFSYGDANHDQVSMFTILGYGLTADHEFNQQNAPPGYGDDLDIVAGTPNYDDEDAIFRNGTILEGQTIAAGVTEVLDVVTFGNGYLSGWVDLNIDGDFLDPGEKVLNDVAINSTTVQTTSVSMFIPLTATGGTAYARFRFDTQPGIAHNGSGLRGEVEDYQIQIDPMKPQYNMVKTSDTAVINAAGQITYTFTFTNSGNVPLSNLTLTDPDIDSGSLSGCPIATLAVGATATCTATRTISLAQIDSGAPLNNTASTTAEDPVGGAVNESDTSDNSTQTTITPVFSHDIVKATPTNADEDGSGDISAGDTLTYTVTASNTGTATLTNLVVQDAMLNPSSQTCASVAPGATCVLVGTYTVTAADVTATTIDNTATAASDQTTSLSDTESVPLLTPDLGIVKSAPANADEDGSTDVSVGDTLSYTVTATNNGTATLTNVVVSDPMLTPGTATCASLAPSATCVLTGDHVVTAADVTAGTIDNTATADSDQTGPVDDTQTVPVLQPSLALVKPTPVNGDQDGSGDVSVGDVLTYTITATNNGTSTLTNVVVSDPLITPTSNTCASVAPTATCVLTGTYTVTAQDVTAGSVDNTATADSDQTPPADDTQSLPIDQPGLALDKAAPTNADEDGSGDVSVGDTLTYTVTATNSGSTNLTNVVVNDPMLTPGSASCALVAPLGTCVLTGTYTVTAADVTATSIVNTASADSDQTDSLDDTETVNVPTPSLAISKPAPANGDQDGSGDFSVGDVLTYTVTATNNGTAILTNVVVNDPLLTPTSNTCASVAPNATCVLTGTYTVTAADVAAGTIDNTATADSDQTPPVDDSQTVALDAPSHVLDKAAPANADEDNSGDVSAGDTLTYTITATNNGQANLTNLVVSDPMLTPTSINCASVAPAGTCVLVGTYTVTAADVVAGSIVNTATSSSDQTGPVDDTETVPVPQPDLALVKPAPTNNDVDSSGDISAGDILTYVITATNNGTAVLTNVVVSDPLINPATNTCASVAPNATCVLTGTYVVTAADVIAGSIDNTATADSDQTPPVDDDQTVPLLQPSLALVKPAPVNGDQDNSADVSAGDVLTYTITATNNGAAGLTNVVVSDPLLTPTTNTCAAVAVGGTCVLVGTYTVTAADVIAGVIDNTASADSDQTDPVDDSQTVALNTPDLILDKAAPTNADEDSSTDISVADTLSYTITATNNGTANLTNVVVSDPMLTPNTITCASVAPGATCVLTGTYSVTAADVTAGQIDNTATADSDQTDPIDDTETVPVPTPSHTLSKAVPVNADEDTSGDVSAGDTLTYTITATNNGTATLTNLVVSDPLITPTSTTCATVAPNATCVLVGTYTATAADVTAGQIDNTATSSSDQTGPVDDSQSVVLDAPSLALDKAAPTNADEDGSTDVSVGDTLTYTVTATNNGAANLTNVVVSDPMLTPNSTTCASVAPNATCVLTGTYSVTAADVTAGSIVNTATADSDQTPPIDDTETVPVPTPSHTLTKAVPANADEDNSLDVSAGDTLTYTITATNNGTATLTNLVVSDPLIVPTSTTCASVAPTATCVLVGTYTVTAADVAAGQIDNTATSASDQTGPVDDSQSVVLDAPSLALDKAAPANADEDGSADVSVADTLTYTVTATNNGTANLTNVVVSDPMLSPNTITCASVAPGGTCVLVGTYSVTAADVAAGQITNTASADSDQTGPIDDTEVVPVPSPGLALDKAAPVNADEDGSTDVSVADTLTYTVTATNNGSSNLTNVVVSDPMLTPNTITCANVAPGATCVLVGTYSVTAPDVAATQITNTASADSDQTGPLDDTEIVPVPSPGLALDKAAPVNADEDASTDVSVADTLTYTVTATNNGSSNLTNVVVSDPMLTPNTITCANVAPGATCVLVGTYSVTAADVAATQINNTASADSDQTGPIDDSEVVPVPQPSHVLVKAIPVNADEDSSGDISVGDTLTYTITATNNGTAILTNMVVSDPMITPNTTTCASVAPTATCVLTGTYTVTAADVAAGQIDNTASSDTDQTGPEDAPQTVVLNAPSLALDKAAPVNADEDGSTDVSVADTLTYTVTATNNGSSNLTNVVVSDPMLTPNTITCANVAPGATCVLVGTYSVTAADVAATQITNTAGADSDQTDPIDDTEVVPVPTPGHVLVKAVPVNADEDGSNDVSVGDTLTYTITATNNGTAILTNMVVSDPMIAPNSTTCASVAPTATCVLTGTYTVTAADVAAGQIDNVATSDTDQTGPEDAPQTVVLNAPGLALDKTAPVNADEDGSTDVSVADTLTYTVTATNNGSSNLTNVVVSDPMLTPNTITCATVAPGGTCVLAGTYSVTAADVAAGQITNTASADSDQTDPIDDTEVVPVPTPSHALVKAVPVNADEDGSGDISVGDTLTYTITATNDGTAILTNMVVSDPMIAPNSTTCASVAPTATCVLTGTYSVTAADVAAGQIDNVATSDTDQTGPEDAPQTVVLNAPSLALDKAAPVNADEDGSTDVSVADTLTYTVTATNNGSSNLTNVVVSDPMLTPNTITCANVAPGATCVLVGTYSVTAADVAATQITNTAGADSDQTNPIDDTEVVPVPQPSHALVKSVPVNADEDASNDISVGDTLTYTITATNDGTAILTNMVVSDPMITPNATTCASVLPTATCVLTGTYVVTAADVAAGQIDNIASSDTDQTGAEDAPQSVVLNAPSLALDKTAPVNADEDGSTDVSVADTLTYTVTATNNGSSNLTNVVVSDPMLTPNSITCGNVAPGATCVLAGTYSVTAADVAAGQITNTAGADSDQTDPIDDTEVVPVPTPSHALVKAIPVNADEDGSGDISVGDTLTYTITATNDGTAVLTNMVVSDPMITPNSTTCASVAPTATCVLTGTYSVTAADVAAGQIDNIATSDTDQTGPEDAPQSVVLNAPGLVLDKAAPVNADEDGTTDVSVADTLTYTVTATNNGSSNLTGVVVSDPMLTPNSITCANVAPGSTCVLVGTYSVTAADVAATQITNTASADSDQTDPVDDTEIVPVPTPGHALVKSAPVNADEDGSTDISAGDTLTYTITATNDGTAVLTNLVVSDPMITPNTTTCASVAPTATCVLTGTYVVTAADVAAGQIDNIATSDTDQTGPEDAPQSVVLNAPNLALDKAAPVNADEDGTTDISVADTLTYTVTATNNGSSTLTGVVVSDPMLSPNTTTCASVAPGTTCVLVGTYSVTANDVAAAQITNTASADSDQTGPIDDTEVVPVPQPSHALVKAVPVNADEDGSGDMSVGDTLTYTITATNDGTAVLTNLVISDPMIAPNTTTCASVAPTATCVLTGTYTVTAADVAAGQINNTATSDTDQTGPEDAPQTVVLNAPSLTMVKAAPVNADEDASGDVSAGDTLTYTITATNNGSTNLTNVVVSDPLLTPSTTTCGSVASGATCVLTGTYTVTPADVAAGQIDNTATADSDQTDPVDDTHSQPLDAPLLALDKAAPVNADEDGSTDVSVGDTLTYTITATNNGGSNLTNLVVSDPLLVPNAQTCASVAPTGTCVLVGNYTVTAADVAAGQIDNTATADSDQTGPVSDDETVPVPTPSHVLVKAFPANADEDASGDFSAGDTLTYTITATNDGTAILTNLVVSDPMIMPSSTTCASVSPGATCVLVGDYVVAASDVAAGQIDNTATSASDQSGPVDDDQSVSLSEPVLTLVKAAPVNADDDNSGDLSAGDTLTYTITASNAGGSNLTNVVVSDSMISPNSTSCATLAPGATCVLVGTYMATAADVSAGQITNTATADSDQTDPVDDTHDLPLSAPALTLVKAAPANADEDGTGDVSVNDTLTYTITATNSGGSNLTNVVVSDLMLTPNSISCASVAPGATCVLVGTYSVTVADVVAGQIDNIATADSDQTAPVDDDHSLPVAAPDLSIVKAIPANSDEDASGDISVGDTLTYTITATNSGTSNLTNVVVSDPLINPATRTCAVVTPGLTCVLTGVYIVNAADVVAGQIANTASADSDQIGPVQDDVTVPVPPPALTLVKSLAANADEDGSGDVTVGDTLSYTAVATNTGSSVLTNLVVTDPILTPDTITCAAVAPQATCVLNGTYAVTSADVAAGGIVNTATADSDQLDPVADSHTVVVETPELGIVKSDPVNADNDNSGNISVGDVLTYTITSTNTGATALTNVVVNDPMLTPSSNTCALVPQAATCVLTGNYTVSANDATAGGIVNTATANSDQTDPIADSNTVVVIPLFPPVTTDNSETDLPLGQPVTIDVLADDSDPENNIDPTTVVIIDPATGNPVTSLVVPGEGTWVVDPATGAITFTPEPGFIGDPTPILYTVTDTTGLVSNPSSVTLDYEAPASLTGTVWLDMDRDGEIDADEPIKPGWTLEIYDDAGNLVATTATDENGQYQVEGLVPGTFTVKFFNDAGVYIAESTTDGPVAAGANVDLPLPVDPSGIVYDSITREPVPGVTLNFVNSLGVPVDPVCLNANQQGQTTQADGFYAFDIFPDAHPSCPDGETYTIEFVNIPQTYIGAISQNIPPQAGIFDSASTESGCTVDSIPQSNACEVQGNVGAPQNGQDTRYFLSFTLTSGDTNVILNHIPLDPFVSAAALANMRLQKTVNRGSASTGDVLYYTVTVENELEDDATGVSVSDNIPDGFRFVDGSANVVTFDATNNVLSQTSVVTTGVDPVVFTGLTVPAIDTGVISINYAVRVGAGVLPGNHINTAQVTEGGTSNIAQATVTLVPDPVLSQSTILGKVFHDRDDDGYQEDAYASNVTIKSDYFGWSSLNAGDLPGRSSRQDPLTDHQLVVSMPVGASNRFEVVTAEGTYLAVDDNLQITESHFGKRARGMTAQDLQITVRKTTGVPTPSSVNTSAGVADVLEITIANIGIDEEGLPGVRLATVSGLLIESDQAGRFHIPDAATGKFAEGEQFIVKLDPATLPAGATLTTENPRVIRITGSALNTMNFGVSLPASEPVMAAAAAAPAQLVKMHLGSVFFDTDKHNIREDQAGVVQDLVNKLRKVKRGRIIISAHTDLRQTREYNIALAKRRARTVENELRRILGEDVMNHVVVEVDSSAYREASPTGKVEEPQEIKQ